MTEQKKPGTIKNDLLLIGILLLVGAVIFLIVMFRKEGDKVTVRIDGRTVAEYSLSENRTEEVAGAYGKNIIEIKNGKVRVIDADCKDRLCVKMGYISRNGQSVICLPHKLSVEVTSDKEAMVDGVTD